MRFSWPQDQRIRKRRHFLHIQESGVRFKSRDLIFFFLPSNDEKSRFGLTVSKKVGNAVVRNRVKRLLRESIRTHYHTLSDTYDVVIVAKRSCKTLNINNCNNQLSQFLKSMRCLSH